MAKSMMLYHASYQIIREPDIHCGRKNADFGQGFYLSAAGDFAGRWARERRGEQVYVNRYALNLSGLTVHRFGRDGDWFDYIFANRRGRAESLPEADMVIGPIANDTLYNTYGIFTSGLLEKEQALHLLQIGPCYEQIAIKTERAAAQLCWLEARVLSSEELAAFRKVVEEEEAAYQAALAAAMEGM